MICFWKHIIFVYVFSMSTLYVRRKFRSQTSDNMDRWKSRGGKSQRREEKKKEDQGRERVRRQKMQVREKVAKVAKHCVFPMICASGGSKSRLAKKGGCGDIWPDEMSKKCTLLWCEAHFEVNMYKKYQVRTTFGSCDVEKVHAVVARSTFASETAKNTSRSDHFWKLRCRKSARRCGAKHMSKSKCEKH